MCQIFKNFFNQKPATIEKGCNNVKNTNFLEGMDQKNTEEKIEQIIIENPVFNNKGLTVILDNGHSSSTKGKRSPKFKDGTQLMEYKFNRIIVKRIAEKLNCLGIEYFILVPEEDKDIALSERAERANMIARDKRKSILISVHGNAGGNGTCFTNASGWEVWTTTANNNSDKLASCFMDVYNSIFPDKKNRGAKEKDYTILYKANCPCVLTENFFYDNEKEGMWMLTEDAIERISQLHVEAIKLYIEKYL